MSNQQVQKSEANLPSTSYEDRYSGGAYAGTQYSVPPQVKILHALSPEVIKTNAAYVEGAGPGMIFLSNIQRLVPGETGILFQPCVFAAPWQLRMSRQSGMGARYLGEFATPQPNWEKRHAKEGYDYYVTPEGHEARQIHKHAGFVHLDDQVLPYIIPFAGTGIFISRKWTGIINSQRTPSGKQAAPYNFLYKMTVKARTNQQGEWGQWYIVPSRRVTEAEYDAGEQLTEEFESQDRRMEGEAEEFTGRTISGEATEENPL